MDKLHERISTLENEISILKKQKLDFEEIQAHCNQMMLQLTQGMSQIDLFNEMVRVFQKEDPSYHLCFVSCDQEGGNWRLDAGSNIVNELVTPNKALISVPTELCYLQSEVDHGIHEADLHVSNGWKVWQPWLRHNGLDRCLLKPILSPNELIIGFVILFTKASYLSNERYALELMVNSLCRLTFMSIVRCQIEEELLNASYEDALTGLLLERRFISSFSIMIKDARRYFQRLALISVNIHNGDMSWENNDIEDSDILEIANVMRSAIRENDLIGRFGQNEFAMGIRIRNLEDAETVALKLLNQIDVSCSNISSNTRVALGISFYPEHSNYESMFLAAVTAAKKNVAENGFKIEYHGRYCDASADLYDF
ncbi:GGDEF domain-containing protein [Marinomonas algicola]|uniref:GGDEF domain-containing protein n=1 Tax=Marinomonas algicola TaxID=2773454 RepID=UPI00174CBEED|nr:diguanylate cyclase [Marinomonas algicola]